MINNLSLHGRLIRDLNNKKITTDKYINIISELSKEEVTDIDSAIDGSKRMMCKYVNLMKDKYNKLIEESSNQEITWLRRYKSEMYSDYNIYIEGIEEFYSNK